MHSLCIACLLVWCDWGIKANDIPMVICICNIKAAFFLHFLFHIFRPTFDKLNCTVKTVLSGHSKMDKTKISMTNGSLMKVKSIAECSPWSNLQYFWPALSYNWSWKQIFGLFFRVAVLEWFYCIQHLRNTYSFIATIVLILYFQSNDILNAILEGYPKPKKQLYVSIGFKVIVASLGGECSGSVVKHSIWDQEVLHFGERPLAKIGKNYRPNIKIGRN